MMFRRDAPQPAPLPAWAPSLWRITHLALGDDRSATVLMVDVLAQAPAHEGVAVKLVADRLPEGWLSWPGAAGPGEWLRLKLRREQADRLLSVLGEWSGRERLALGLYLLWDVPRDELDKWLGTTGMAQSVAELIGHVGDSLDLVDPPSDNPACVLHRPDLLEAHDHDAPPPLRLHLLGCAACRTYAAGLRRSKALVRQAVDVFFRQAPPLDHLCSAAVRPRASRQHLSFGPLLVPLLVAGLIAAAVILRPHRAPATLAAQGPALTATDVLDRALDRFAQAPRGVFHEQARTGNNADAVVIDRWFDQWKRVRITVHSATNEPILDVSSDGTQRISYRATLRTGGVVDALLEPSDMEKLLPLVRQLPFVGSFGSLPIEQDMLDVTLVAQARRGTLALLGTRRWNDRSGYLISSMEEDGSRLLLLVDAHQFNLLHVQRVLPNATPQTLWQAQIVETATTSPPGTWDMVSERKVTRLLNPRHLLADTTPTTLADVTASFTVPIPTALPEDVVLQYVRTLDEPSSGVLQMYESQWSTVALITARPRYTFRPPRTLPQQFAHGHYAVLDSTSAQATFITFAHDAVPEQRHAVYLWHALASPHERERMLVDLLNGIELADHTNATQYAERFAAPPQPSATIDFVPLERARSAALSPDRRYLRFKLQQTGR